MNGGPAPRGTFAPVALSGGRPPVGRWLAIIVVLLIVVVTKPWPAPAGSDGSREAGAPIRSASGAPATALTSPSSPPDGPGPLVSAFCLDPGAWLVASVERWRDQRIKVWRAVVPASVATGPEDPTIPIVPVVSDGLTELGWCAPASGPEKAGPPAQVTVWLRSSTVARPIAPDTSRPPSGSSPFGALYRPPGRGPSLRVTAWSSGTYVFRYRSDDRRERWFAVEVEIRPTHPDAP